MTNSVSEDFLGNGNGETLDTQRMTFRFSERRSSRTNAKVINQVVRVVRDLLDVSFVFPLPVQTS